MTDGYEGGQRKKLDEIDKELIAKVEKVLTNEQKKILAEPVDFDFSKLPVPGEFLSAYKRDKLKLTDPQTKEMLALQKDIDSKLDKVLTEDQKQGIDEAKSRFRAGGPGGPPPGGPGGPGPKGKGGPRPGGPPPGGPAADQADPRPWVTRSSGRCGTRSITRRLPAGRSNPARRSWKSRKNWIRSRRKRITIRPVRPTSDPAALSIVWRAAAGVFVASTSMRTSISLTCSTDKPCERGPCSSFRSSEEPHAGFTSVLRRFLT